MITALKLKAYLLPPLCILGVILYLILMIGNNHHLLYDFLLFVACLGYLIFTLFSYYKEYSVDSKNLMIRDRITGKQIIIPLINITNLKIKEVHIDNIHYHNIIVETKDKKYILKGAYVEDMTIFFSTLEKAVKRIS